MVGKRYIHHYWHRYYSPIKCIESGCFGVNRSLRSESIKFSPFVYLYPLRLRYSFLLMVTANQNLQMGPKIKRRIVWWFCLLLLFILSYWREVGFRSINAVSSGEAVFYAKTTYFPLLLKLSGTELIKLKYALTISVSLLFIAITIGGIKWGLKDKLGIALVTIIYSGTVILAMLLFIWGFFFSNFQTVYPYLRILIGFIHNPLIFLFISIIVLSSNSFE